MTARTPAEIEQDVLACALNKVRASLKPCPFCGSPADLRTPAYINNPKRIARASVVCPACCIGTDELRPICVGGQTWLEAEIEIAEESAAVWNRRVVNR